MRDIGMSGDGRGIGDGLAAHLGGGGGLAVGGKQLGEVREGEPEPAALTPFAPPRIDRPDRPGGPVRAFLGTVRADGEVGMTTDQFSAGLYEAVGIDLHLPRVPVCSQ